MNFEVCELHGVKVIDTNQMYVMLKKDNEEGVGTWVRRSKILGGWSMKKGNKYRTVVMKKKTAENKGLVK